MIEALAPYTTGLIYLAIELTVILFILVICVAVHHFRKRKQHLQTANEFVNKVESVEPVRREKLQETFSRNLGLEGEELDQKVREFLDKESAFYKTLLTVFLSKETKFLDKAYSELNGVMESWSGIVPEGIVDDAQIKQLNEDIIKLKEENALMSGKVKDNHDEMEALISEYNAAFKKNEEIALKQTANEESKETDVTDQDIEENNSLEAPPLAEPIAEPIAGYEGLQSDEIVDTEFEDLLDISNHESDIDEQDAADRDPAMAIADDLGKLLNAAAEEHSADLIQQNSTDDSDATFLADSDDGLEQSIAESKNNSLTDKPAKPKPKARTEHDETPLNNSADTDSLGDSFTTAAVATEAPDTEPAMDEHDIDALLAMNAPAPEEPARTAQAATPEPKAVAPLQAQSHTTVDAPQTNESPEDNNSQPRQATSNVSSVETKPESGVEAAALDTPLEKAEAESPTPEVADVAHEPKTASDDAVKEPRSPTEQLINNLDFDLSRADEEPEILDITIAEKLPKESGADDDFFDLTKSD